MFNQNFSQIKHAKPPKDYFSATLYVCYYSKSEKNNDVYAIYDMGRAVIMAHILGLKLSK